MGAMIRTLKFDLEERINRKIPIEHPIFGWLVEHASWIVTSRARTDDGVTPYQKVKGNKFHRDQRGFSENVLYKIPEGHLTKILEGKLGA